MIITTTLTTIIIIITIIKMMMMMMMMMMMIIVILVVLNVLFNDELNTCYFTDTLNWVNGSTMKNRSDDPSHNEQTLLPRSYISLLLLAGMKYSSMDDNNNYNKTPVHTFAKLQHLFQFG